MKQEEEPKLHRLAKVKKNLSKKSYCCTACEGGCNECGYDGYNSLHVEEGIVKSFMKKSGYYISTTFLVFTANSVK